MPTVEAAENHHLQACAVIWIIVQAQCIAIKLKMPKSNFKKLNQYAALLAVILNTACTGSAYKLPTINKKEVSHIESQIEADTTGLKIYKRSDANYKNRIARISKRLQKSAAPLCIQSEYPSCFFEVSYNNGNEFNAYAHENYKITLYKGLLQHLKNNDEIAAVIAHEMGHHLSHHNQETAQNAATGAAISGILTAVLLGASNTNNPHYNSTYQQQQNQKTIENMMVTGAKIGAASYSKEQEREADLLAAYLLSHAGYNLERAQNLMYVLAKVPSDKKIGNAAGTKKAAILDTHPPSPERVVAWKKTIEEIDTNKTKLPYLKAQTK